MCFLIFTKLILKSKVCDKFGKTTLIAICDVFHTIMSMNNTFIWFKFYRNVVD